MLHQWYVLPVCHLVYGFTWSCTDALPADKEIEIGNCRKGELLLLLADSWLCRAAHALLEHVLALESQMLAVTAVLAELEVCGSPRSLGNRTFSASLTCPPIPFQPDRFCGGGTSVPLDAARHDRRARVQDHRVRLALSGPDSGQGADISSEQGSSSARGALRRPLCLEQHFPGRRLSLGAAS